MAPFLLAVGVVMDVGSSADVPGWLAALNIPDFVDTYTPEFEKKHAALVSGSGASMSRHLHCRLPLDISHR